MTGRQPSGYDITLIIALVVIASALVAIMIGWAAGQAQERSGCLAALRGGRRHRGRGDGAGHPGDAPVSDAGRDSLFNEAALRGLIGEIVAEKLAAARPQYMSVADAARMAAVSGDFIREQIAAGRLGRYRAGREWRVKQSELEARLSATVAPAPTPDAPAMDSVDAAVLRFRQKQSV